MLCSTIHEPDKISYSSLQFIRYVSLLEKVQTLKADNINTTTLAEIYMIIVSFAESPELKTSSVSGQLATLQTTMLDGLLVDEVEKFVKEIHEFVDSAMEWYTVLPVSH